jgi:hypothetical protein
MNEDASDAGVVFFFYIDILLAGGRPLFLFWSYF